MKATQKKSAVLPKKPITIPLAITELMGPEEIAKALKVDRTTVYRMIATGDFPPCDLRVPTCDKGKPRWKTTTYQAWLESKTQEGPDERSVQA